MYPSLFLETINKAKLPELKQICKDLGLKSGGLKADIINRIYNAYKGDYMNYHHLVPSNKLPRIDIGTAIIYSVNGNLHEFTLSSGEIWYSIVCKIGYRYDVKTQEYQYIPMKINFRHDKKRAQEMLDIIKNGILSDKHNIYMRYKYHNMEFLYGPEIVIRKNNSILLFADPFEFDLLNYPIGYVESNIEAGLNKYMDVIKPINI